MPLLSLDPLARVIPGRINAGPPFPRSSRLASTDVVEIRHDLECVVAVSAGVAIGPVG